MPRADKIFAVIVFLCFVAMSQGCTSPEKKEADKAAKLQKQGKHAEAIGVFSKLAKSKGLPEDVAKDVQFNFCNHYGDKEKREEIKGFSDKLKIVVADSCAEFYKLHPGRTQKGLGPFLVGLMYKEMKKYDKALDAFKKAERKGYYDRDKVKESGNEKSNCIRLYENMIECHTELGNEKQVVRLIKKGANVCGAKKFIETQ